MRDTVWLIASFLILLLLLLLLTQSSSSSPQPGSTQLTGLNKITLNTDGQFIDTRGFIKLFRGFNSVRKSFPWYSQQVLNITQMKMFQNWGINTIRLQVMWSGVYPHQSTINTTYLDQIEKIVNLFAQYNIYVILDMHQDALSSRYGTYDGIPLWLIDQFKRPSHALQYPWPYKQAPNCEMCNYLTYECSNAAQQLYDNVSNSWSHWGDFWEVIAERFRHTTNVLGYELINEPPPGNYYTNPLRGLSGYAGRYNLQPVYDYLVERIRKHDTETLIFYEPITYGIFTPFTTSWLGTGFERVPGANKDKSAPNKSVLSYHYYCWILQTENSNSTMPFWKKIVCDEFLLPDVISNAIKAMQRTGGGRFLTEFGICGDDGNANSVNTVECNAILDEVDKRFESWTYWDGNFLDEMGNPIDSQVKSFIRPYPQSTNGKLKKLRFNHKTGEFHFVFLHSTNPSLLKYHLIEVLLMNKSF
uniref:Glycoside hydrolase family 5 domain-containing protein n=1 Tax=Trichobilharzia regenti TaxID=157069 RepID=A0AA85JCN5_TRIRE|nr:unnamed protein product [Trichobilharzia regenti]